MVKTLTEAELLAQKETFQRGAWEALRFFLPRLRPLSARIALVCALDIAGIILNFIPPLFGKWLVDNAFPDRNWESALQLSMALFGTQLAIQALLVVRNMLNATIEMMFSFALKKDLIRQMERMSVSMLESEPVAQRVFRTRIDADMVTGVTVGFFPTLTRFLEFGLILLAATALDPLATLITFLLLIPWVWLNYRVTTTYRDLDRLRLRRAELRDSVILQGTSSFGLLKSFHRQQWLVHKHVRRSVSTQRIANRHWQIWWYVDWANRVLNYLRTGSVTFYLWRKVVLGETTLGSTIPMLAYLTRLADPVRIVVEFINNLRRSMIPAERCMQILLVETSVPLPTPGMILDEPTGHVRFEDVTLVHPNGAQVLTDVNLDLTPGRRVAIVGPSGAGKSTIAALAVRLFDPTEGRILVDGQDLRTLNLHHLLQRYAVVSQDTWVFLGTVAENLRYGKKDATEEEMRSALDKVGLLPWLDALPHGLAQDLESGIALSVGQRQRLGIARVLLADPKVMILDEPTSALDSETEAGVMETLWQVSESMTVLLITHRLNTVLACDEVVVLQKGSVVERGAPNDLVATGGPFADMLAQYRGSHG